LLGVVLAGGWVCWVMYLVFNSAVFIHIGWLVASYCGWPGLDVGDVVVVACCAVGIVWLVLATWRDSEKCASKLCNHEHKKCCACNPTAHQGPVMLEIMLTMILSMISLGQHYQNDEIILAAFGKHHSNIIHKKIIS
jgi:hypothetical protein